MKLAVIGLCVALATSGCVNSPVRVMVNIERTNVGPPAPEQQRKEEKKDTLTTVLWTMAGFVIGIVTFGLIRHDVQQED